MTTTMTRRWCRPLAGLVLAAAALVITPGPARATPDPSGRHGAAALAAPAPARPGGPAQTAGTVSEPALVAQTALVPANGTFSAQVDIGPLATADLDVAVTVYSVLDDAAGLDAAPSRPINRLDPVPLADLPVDGSGILTLDLPIRSGEPLDDVERVRIPDPGVYPVVVELSDDAGLVASIRLDLIRLPEPDDADATRSLALGLGVGGGSGLTVAEATTLLGAHPDLPITVLLATGVVNELRDDPVEARRFAAAVDGRPVVAVTEPTLDPSALAAIDQPELYESSVATTSAALIALQLFQAPGVALVPAPLTGDGAELVTQTGVTVAVDVSDPLAGDNQPGPNGILTTATGPLTVVELDGGGATVPAGPSDDGTDTDTDLVRDARGPALSLAHRQLARLMLEAPGGPPRLLGGFGPSSSPAIDGAAGDTARPEAVYTQPVVLDVLLDAVTRYGAVGSGPTPSDPDGDDDRPSPVAPLTLVPLDTAAHSAATTALTPAPAPSRDLAGVAAGLRDAQALLLTYDSFYVSGTPTPAALRSRLANALGLSQPPAQAQLTVESVNRELNDELTVISLPENQSFTVAARRVLLPLTIVNSSDGARNVLLRFRSDKIVVAEHGQVITVEPGTKSVDLQVETRSLGVSPLEVIVLTPDGRLLDSTRFQLRSTAVPGLGLAISVAGLAALSVWWYLSIKRRRASRGADEPGGTPPTGEDATGTPVDRTRTLVGDSVEP